jgi:uncharacterized membrane protein
MFFTALMVRITCYYIPIQYDVAFLQIKQEYIHIQHWLFAFFVHVFTSIFTLIAGFTQFSSMFLRKYPRLHRFIGKIYVIDILFITGPAGLVMSFYANGGIPSRIAFLMLSLLWMSCTAMAWITIRKRKIQQHKEFMMRSYALTFSAITLRAWKYALVFLFQPAPMDVYRLVAWLGWVPNLLLVEYWIYLRKKR